MIKVILTNRNTNLPYEVPLMVVNRNYKGYGYEYYLMVLGYDEVYYCIAKKLGIPVRDYYNVMMRNNAFFVDDKLMFEFEEDAEKAFSEIEAYLIMNKIIG